jgi:hypothetical protein
MPDASLTTSVQLLNIFISKCLGKDPPRPQIIQPSQAKGRKTKPEVVHETLELALAAAHKCTKCEPTTRGTKGCSACMGDWFNEHMRINKAPVKFLKAIGIDEEGIPSDEVPLPPPILPPPGKDAEKLPPLEDLEPTVPKKEAKAKATAEEKEAKKLLKDFKKDLKEVTKIVKKSGAQK